MALHSVAEGLTLSLLEGVEPFGLAEKENFGPDDWAWLFLSMNEDYAKEFEEQASKRKPGVDALQPFCVHDITGDVIPDEDGQCRSRFGLAAWINPSLERLPPLVNESESSWFFPLMSPVLEYCQRPAVSNGHLRHFSPSNKWFKYPNLVTGPKKISYLEAVEAALGYLPTRTAPRFTSSGLDVGSWELAWAAIDCSIPPDGQLRAFSWLVMRHRKRLQEFGYKTHDNLGELGLLDVGKADAFSCKKFNKAAAAREGDNIHNCYAAICVDVLGPVMSQLKGYAKLLHQKHKKLRLKGVGRSPFPERFRNSLPMIEGARGGSWLKTIHVLYELSCWGHSLENIDKIIGEPPLAPAGGRPAWRDQLVENMGSYIEQGRAMVNENYRWLIYAQKPGRVD